jgi:hypothetical protein
MSEVRNLNSVSIEWESSGYSVLKDLDASILGIFCEFIDNSIQSYRDEKEQIILFEHDYKLKIDLIFTGQEIIIKDNAGGIDTDNFERALKPANRPKNNKGFNEFGIGMKYAAVWVSNEWELKSKSYKENLERTVVFNYYDVINNNIKSLIPKETKVENRSHGTEIILRNLEKERVSRWQEKYLKNKIASIYRNFIRAGGSFYSDFSEDQIEIRYNGEILTFSEFNFLKAPWWQSIQIDLDENAPEIEWKWKFPWRKIEILDKELNPETGEIIELTKIIEVAGFVGILPDGDHNGKNGFTLFRRGRVIEGTDNRIYPIAISTSSARDFKYIRLYGEIHFRNLGVSFNKSRLNIDNETRNEIFAVLASELKRLYIDGIQYDMLQQANKHRVGFKIANAKNAIESRQRELAEKNREPLLIEKTKEIEEIISNTVIDESYNLELEKINSIDNTSIIGRDELPENFRIGIYTYTLKINYLNSDSMQQLYTTSIIENDENKEINIGINLKHLLFTDYPDNIKDSMKFNLIIEFIKCLAKSEVNAIDGLNTANSFKHAFNLYSKTITL